MPLIEVIVTKDVVCPGQRCEFLTKLTQAPAELEGENTRQVTPCVVREVAIGDWGVAGIPLTTADVRPWPLESLLLLDSISA